MGKKGLILGPLFGSLIIASFWLAVNLMQYETVEKKIASNCPHIQGRVVTSQVNGEKGQIIKVWWWKDLSKCTYHVRFSDMRVVKHMRAFELFMDRTEEEKEDEGSFENGVIK